MDEGDAQDEEGQKKVWQKNMKKKKKQECESSFWDGLEQILSLYNLRLDWAHAMGTQ